MTQANQETANTANGMESVQDSADPATRALEGQLLKRRRRRRLDLKTLHGTLRESAKVYRELVQGEISMAEAEVRSRVLRRHGEILGQLEVKEYLEQLEARVAVVESQKGLGSEQPISRALTHDTAVHTSAQTEDDGS
jgi:hypothetical protein